MKTVLDIALCIVPRMCCASAPLLHYSAKKLILQMPTKKLLSHPSVLPKSMLLQAKLVTKEVKA